MRRATHTTPSDRRGQAAVVGIVLLVGIVAIGSVGILLLGANANEQSQSQARNERVEGSFVELDSDINSVASSQSDNRVVDLDLPDDADVAIRRENAGTIVVNRTNLTTTSTVVVKKIGAIVYEHDGTHFAYQAGAVWRGQGKQTRMVSAPSVEYDVDGTGTNPTLTLPINDLEGPKNLNSGDLNVERIGTYAPLNDVATIDNQVVSVKITSDYYVGWANYFRERYDNVLVDVYHSNDTTVVKLGRPGIDGGLDHTVYAMDGGINASNNAEVNGPVAAAGGTDCGDVSCTTSTPQGAFEPLDPVIEQKVRRAETDPSYAQEVELDDGPTLTSTGDSIYYDDEGVTALEDESITVDLSAGNVTLIVNGSLILDQQVDIKVTNGDDGGEHAFRVYMTGDLGVEQSRFCVAPCSGSDPTGGGAGTRDAEDNQIYGTSNMTVAIRGGSNTLFEGAIYAPREEEEEDDNRAAEELNINADTKCDDGDGDPWHADFCMVSGSSSFYGAAIIGPTQVSQDAHLNYDSDLADTPPVLQESGVVPPPLTFLHVAVNRVCVSNDEECEAAPIATVDGPITVEEGASAVELSTDAYDYDGGSVTVSWSVVDGPSGGTLSDVSTRTPEYEPPDDVSGDRTVTVELTVTDDEGRTSTVVDTFLVEDTDDS